MIALLGQIGQIGQIGQTSGCQPNS